MFVKTPGSRIADLEGIMLSEINQTEKDKLYDFNYMWNLKNKANKTETNHRYTEQTSGCQGSGVGLAK